MDAVPPPLRRNWSEECDAERDLKEEAQATTTTTSAPFFNRVVEFEEEKEEDVYKPQPEIPGLVLPGIERRRSSKKKRSTAQIADIAEKASYLNVLIWGEATHVIGS